MLPWNSKKTDAPKIDSEEGTLSFGCENSLGEEKLLGDIPGVLRGALYKLLGRITQVSLLSVFDTTRADAHTRDVCW